MPPNALLVSQVPPVGPLSFTPSSISRLVVSRPHFGHRKDQLAGLSPNLLVASAAIRPRCISFVSLLVFRQFRLDRPRPPEAQSMGTSLMPLTPCSASWD